MKQKININNYDFLWLIKNWTYFDTSFWLVKNYLKRDFLIISKEEDWITYVSKEERKKLSKFGLNFFKHKFENYKNKLNKLFTESENKFVEIKSKQLHKMKDKELSNDFIKTMNFCIKLWEPYWFTQYFLYDYIEEIINNKKEGYKELETKVKEMQKLKFKLRIIVNKTMFKNEDYILKNYFDEIQKRTKIKNLHDYSYIEISKLILGEKIKIKNRKNYVLGKFNNWKLIEGKEAINLIKKIEEQKLKNIKEIKGIIANKGYFKGYVKIINFDLESKIEKECLKFKKGEILVTGSTIPQMMVACINSGAIITEEGGIVSHAAIVSRELKKPCIIGTKNATKILKNGDLIEVDAYKGIIKIIK